MNCFISFLVTSLNPFGNAHLMPVSFAESIYSFLNCFSIQNIKALTSVLNDFVLIYRKFRLCNTKASGKAHTPYNANDIISQIGRENKSDIPTSSE